MAHFDITISIRGCQPSPIMKGNDLHRVTKIQYFRIFIGIKIRADYISNRHALRK